MEWFESDDFWQTFYSFMFSEERFVAAQDEVSQITALTQCAAGSVLDLCCGPGRHAVEFAKRGFRVTGVDASRFLLDRACQHAGRANVTVELVKEDMRLFIRPGAFDLVCNLFTSFGYFREEEDDLRVLANIHESLRSGGVLVMELIGKERLARTWQNAICTDLADGALLVQRPQLRDDWSRVASEWILIRDGEARSFSFEHSLYSGRELKDRLRNAGFGQVDLFGSLQGTPFDLKAPRLIAVARKQA